MDENVLPFFNYQTLSFGSTKVKRVSALFTTLILFPVIQIPANFHKKLN